MIRQIGVTSIKLKAEKKSVSEFANSPMSKGMRENSY